MKFARIVFRHRDKTIECFEADGCWQCSVQGEKNPRHPFKSPGEAVQEGINVTEKHAAIRSRLQRKKTKLKQPALASIMRKASF